MLAGIPSIIYGIWGLFVFAPFFQVHVQQPGHRQLRQCAGPVRTLFAGPPYGIGIFTAALILSIMILPFISAVTRDVFETVPPMLKEAAYGLGCTTWEVMWRIVLPFSRTGVVGGAMLALGRALGETMAVTFVIGNAHHIHDVAVLARHDDLGHHRQRIHRSAGRHSMCPSLIAIGLILFVITFIVLASAQLMLRGLERRSGGRSQ